MAPPRRRRPSSVDRLDTEAKELIGKLRIDHGWSISEILDRLRQLGQDGGISRSALGRHIKTIEEVGEQLRESREIAKALVDKVGDAAEDKTAELNIELMHGMVLKMLTSGESAGDPETALQISRSLQSLAAARKTNTDMVLKVRLEAAKEAAKKVETVGKSQGLTTETIDLIRHAVLGTTT